MTPHQTQSLAPEEWLTKPTRIESYLNRIIISITGGSPTDYDQCGKFIKDAIQRKASGPEATDSVLKRSESDAASSNQNPTPSSPAVRQGEQEKVLESEWRISNGFLCCGTLRIMREDFDTDPNPKFKTALFNQIVTALNAKASGITEAVTYDPAEEEAIRFLCQRQGLNRKQLLRQALREYQFHVLEPFDLGPKAPPDLRLPEAVTESVEATRQSFGLKEEPSDSVEVPTQKELPENVVALLRYINATPTLLSLLYDIDMMPEQLERFTRPWGDMLIIAEHFRVYSRDAARLDWLELNKCGVVTWSKDGPDGLTQMVGFIVDDMRYGIELARDTVRGAIDAAMQRTQGAVTSVSDGGSSDAAGASSPKPSPPLLPHQVEGETKILEDKGSKL